MEETKTKKTGKGAKIALAIVSSILGLAVIGMGIGLYFTTNGLTQQSMSLEGVYQRSFYDLVENVNSLENEVSKLMVTKNEDSQHKSLLTIKQQSADASSNLSRLPFSSNMINQTEGFINQLNGYFTSLLKRQGGIPDDQYDVIYDIYDSITKVQGELNKVSYKLSNGYRIMDNLDGSVEVDGFSLNFAGISSDSIEYPSMIYDGPFSESMLKKEIRGIPNTETSEGDAREFVKEVFDISKNSQIEYLGETNGNFKTYDYKINTNQNDYYVQVTKKGKFLLTVSADAQTGAAKIDSEEALKRALGMVEKLGIKDMQRVWSAEADGIAYINLAPVIDDITIYPDLIKVKVDMVTGNVMGYEASSYANNHTNRKLPEPKNTKEQAQSQVSDKLEIKNDRLCVIPLESGGETMAYEFEAEANGHTYYVYIDAGTNEQIRIMRVIKTTQGNLIL
ncbi:MAG: germination protein YpeB [Christensenellaceae bacterium]|jgi:germination protein YpeB|nr:germination protein YpeB [Christensenellaceae bacterium]